MGAFHRRERQANVVGGRPGRFEVTTTVAETMELRRLAGEQRMSVPRLLVSSALASAPARGAVTSAEITDLLGMISLLGRISVNVNQIAKVDNATSDLPDDAGATMAAVRALAVRISGVLDEIEATRR